MGTALDWQIQVHEPRWNRKVYILFIKKNI